MAKFSKKIRVGVIFGGRSGEHEVSLVSAKSVIDHLDKKKYQVIPIGVDKNGNWIFNNPMMSLKTGRISEKQGSRLLSDKILNKCDVIFPLIHGSFGEDGTLQGMLEMANIAYVGGGVMASSISMDKVVQKQICQQVGIRVVVYDWFLKSDWKNNRTKILQRIARKLKYPIFTKPANLGSSVGISKCHNQAELISGINQAAKYDRKIIVEQGIENIDEIEVGILGNDNPLASVVGQVVASNEFYDYDAKYIDGKSEIIIPAKLPKKVIEEIQAIAIESFKALDLSGLARVDFLVKRGSYTVYLNELNTIPGFTSISMYPRLWQASGLAYQKLLDKLITLAISRHQEKNKLDTSYSPKSDWHQ